MLFIFRVQNSHPHHITITTTTNITSVELIEEQRTIHLSLTNGWILLTEGKRSRSESLTVANHVLHLPYQNNKTRFQFHCLLSACSWMQSSLFQTIQLYTRYPGMRHSNATLQGVSIVVHLKFFIALTSLQGIYNAVRIQVSILPRP
jgi:hypothetical protein